MLRKLKVMDGLGGCVTLSSVPAMLYLVRCLVDSFAVADRKAPQRLTAAASSQLRN